MPAAQNYKEFISKLPKAVKLVVVSKTKTPEEILEIYNAGQRFFGENKVQELVEKQETLPKDIEWHMIGHLQTNKVKYIAPFVALIQSVDSIKLLKTINKEAVKNQRIIPCLIQIYIAQEETKYGLYLEEAAELLSSEEFATLKNVEIRGVMGMATFTENFEQIRQEFKNLKNIFELLKKKYFAQQPEFSEISMGMSDDYIVAIKEGSTIVRIGSAIFGSR